MADGNEVATLEQLKTYGSSLGINVRNIFHAEEESDGQQFTFRIVYGNGKKSDKFIIIVTEYSNQTVFTIFPIDYIFTRDPGEPVVIRCEGNSVFLSLYSALPRSMDFECRTGDTWVKDIYAFA